MAFVLVFCVFSFGAYAAESGKTVSFKIENVSKSVLAKKSPPKAYGANGKYYAGTSYKLYDNISDNAKAIYNAFESERAGLASSPRGVIKVNLSAHGRNLTRDKIENELFYACAAITDDEPEYQWLLSAPFKIDYVPASGMLTLTVLLSETPYGSWNEIETEHTALINAVNSFNVSGNNRYERIKSIHDGIVLRASYSKNLNESVTLTNSKLFYPSSALLAPYETVCDGYSKAFKMICDRCNIPCIVVTGYGYTPGIFGVFLLSQGHTWNYVRMEDGKWYAVDLTWDDVEGSSPVYDYFLVGSQTTDKSGYSFIMTHDPVGDRFAGTNLTYPQLSRTKYVYDPSVYENITGDVDKDGEVTVIDAKWILQSVAELRKLNDSQSNAADLNGDNSVTVADAKSVLRLISGLSA